MAKPKISVVIPTYQEEKYIESTLRALRNSDYKKKFEIIVADGGSKDRTVRIARKYADKVVVVKERGIAKGRNAGAREAKGDILLFVDADTVLLFNALSEMEKAFRRRDVAAVTCNVVPSSAQAKDFILYWVYNQFAKASTKTGKAQIAGICFACRRSVFEEVGGFDESIETGEDFDLSERISKLGRIKFAERTLAITSPRRLVKWGRMKGIGKYMEFYINYLLTGKGVSIKKYKPLR